MSVKKRLSKLGEKNPMYGRRGDKSHMWKGDNVGYPGVHKWIREHLPKPDLCDICHEKKKLDAANISGKYLRDFTDWHYICRKCHFISDGRMSNLKQYRNVMQ